MSDQPKTRMITGLVRFSYLAVFAPRPQKNGDPKYSASLIIPKKDKETLKEMEQCIQAAIDKAKEDGKLKLIKGKLPKDFSYPLRDGDEERENEEYEKAMFVNATGYRKPGLVDRDREIITDPDDLYSGAYGRASINFYYFNVDGNAGIACGLNNLQKIKDGERLDGTSNADKDFDDGFEIEDDEEDYKPSKNKKLSDDYNDL